MKRILSILKEKWSEYILEILVITIGILGAYALNNWNETRKAKAEEKALLENLSKDLDNTITELEFLNSLRFKANDATYRILKLSNKISDLNEEELDSLFAQIVTRPTFNGQLGTLQLLISTGKINLLKNQELKSRLITWPGLIDDVKEEEVYANFIFDNAILEGLSQYAVLPEILENVSARKSLVNESTVMTPYEINHQVMKSQYEKLLSDQYFLNQLISRNINFQISYSESRTLIQQANDIKALIKKELIK
jgi:hypothetical protein